MWSGKGDCDDRKIIETFDVSFSHKHAAEMKLVVNDTAQAKKSPASGLFYSTLRLRDLHSVCLHEDLVSYQHRGFRLQQGSFRSDNRYQVK